MRCGALPTSMFCFSPSGPVSISPTVLAPLMLTLYWAYCLSRWLTRNDYDPEDVVQQSSLLPLSFIDASHGTEARAWLLSIVRNFCLSWLEKNRSAPMQPFDEQTMEVQTHLP